MYMHIHHNVSTVSVQLRSTEWLSIEANEAQVEQKNLTFEHKLNLG